MVKLTRRRLLLTTGWIAGGATVLYMLRNRAAAVAPTIIFQTANPQRHGCRFVQTAPA